MAAATRFCGSTTCAQPHRLDLLRLEVVINDGLEHRVHAGMAQRPARIRLERHAGRDDGPGITKLSDQAIQIRAVAEHLEEAPLAVEAVVAPREAPRPGFPGGHGGLARAR